MTELVVTDSIIPDPHQPRTEFKEDVIEGYTHSLETLGQINPIEVDENGVIIRHEQLWRAAKKLGLEKVLVVRKTGLSQARRFERQLADHDEDIGHVDKLWAYTTGVVNINADANYTKEDIKQMYENDYATLKNFLEQYSTDPTMKSGQSELSRRIGVFSTAIGHYLAFFKAPETLRNAFLSGDIELAYLYRTVRLQSDPKQEEIAKILVEDRVKPTEQRRFKTERELGDFVTSFNDELEKQATTKAKELKKEPAPQPQPPKIEPSKEDVDAKTQQIIAKPLKPKKTPAEQAHNSLRGVESKIKKATDEGIETELITSWTQKMKNIDSMIQTNPEKAYTQAKNLKKAINQVKTEKETADHRMKMDEQVKKEIEKEVKEELKHDEAFRKEVKLNAKAKPLRTQPITSPPPPINPELIEQAQTVRASIQAILNDPTTKERGKWFSNWLGHGAILDVAGSTFCPHCEDTKGTLIWSCCNTPIQNAYEEARIKTEKVGQ